MIFEAFLMFITIVLGILLLDFLIKKRRNDIIGNMPGPTPVPLLGNILMYRGQTPEEIMEFIKSNRRQYGPLYRVWIFNQLAVFSCDPNDVEVILSSQQHITKSNLYDLLQNWLGTGLLMSTGKKWHSRRKITTPAFHFKILEQFVDIFEQQSSIMVKKLEAVADGKQAVNIAPYICSLALDVIAETAMGTKVNAQLNPDFPYVKAVSIATNIISKRFIDVWKRNDRIFRLLAPAEARYLDNNIKIMHDFTEGIIMERRRTLEESVKAGTYKSFQEDYNFDINQKSRMALLDILLQSSISGKPLSNEDIREEVDTFMFEGHDTTTSAISFALSTIARHPDVQEKLFNEIQLVLNDESGKEQRLSMPQLSNLKYLECVIKESLRLYPPVPIIGRIFNEDAELNGRRIPAGTNYTIGIFVMLRDPQYFPDPDKFKPERFLNESESNGEKVNPFAYIPFSAGPRNCIGQKFAMLEMKSAIVQILRNFELLPLGPPVKPMMNLVLRSANGYHIGLKPR